MAAKQNGRVALVTGAASGIGRASALAFAEDGARVVAADVSADQGRETVDLIEAAGGEAIFVPADVSRPSDVDALLKAAIETYGRLDCAHNNAGIEGATPPGTAFHDYPDELWDRVLSINLKGVWLCMQAEITQMLAQRGGNIVNTASIAGLVGGFGGAYSAAKHGVVGLTKVAALEYARSGIRVNAVCPGGIRTPMLERVFARRPETEQEFVAGEPVGRLGTPQEIAAAVVWLCSDGASFLTALRCRSTADGSPADRPIYRLDRLPSRPRLHCAKAGTRTRCSVFGAGARSIVRGAGRVAVESSGVATRRALLSVVGRVRSSRLCHTTSWPELADPVPVRAEPAWPATRRALSWAAARSQPSRSRRRRP
jgi:NAD(P)-dependent dehydrogenase (short-subunit alcohol dehydrogenase family)